MDERQKSQGWHGRSYDWLERYLEEAFENFEPCEHGHLGCAGWHAGPCSSEVRAELDYLDGVDLSVEEAG